MKQLLVLAGFAVLLSSLAGCQNANRGVEVTIEGGGEFPEFLVGKWKADKHGWEIIFEPGGSISSVVIPLGKARMKPGQTTIVPMKLGGKGVYKSGDWFVQYSPDSRELAVEIVVEHFRAQIGASAVEGSTKDYLVGMVSEDGKLWYAEWINVPKYIIDVPQHKGRELPIDPNYVEVNMVVFEKVTEE